MILEDVYREYQALGLGGKNGTSGNFVPGEGPCPSKIMVIGEAPGMEEDKAGKPFVGPAGNILNRLLGFVHVQRENVFVTNTFKYRPPENRDPFPSEIIKSMPCLAGEIACVDPAVIILAGKVALSAFFPGKTIRQLRGQALEKGSRKFVCTYHPAAALHSRNDTIEAMMRSDYRFAVKLSKG